MNEDRGSALMERARTELELRSIADYMWLDEPATPDYDPIDAAQRFISGVEQWLTHSDDRQEQTSPADPR